MEMDNCSGSSTDCNESDGDWIEDDNRDIADTASILCLFCDNYFIEMELIIEHLLKVHNFNLKLLKVKFNMDQYSYIKMINYIRSKKDSINPDEFANEEECVWMNDKYLKPSIECDMMLMFDFEDLQDDVEFTLPQEEFFLRKIEDLTLTAKEKDNELEEMRRNMATMRITFNGLLEKLSNSSNYNSSDNSNKNRKINNSLTPNDAYFSSYSHFGIHHEMINDKIRTNAYRSAILENQNSIKDKIVMDLGCGTSILSLFAVKAGAKSVLAIDESDIIYHAMEIGRKNDEMKTIEYFKGRIEDYNKVNEKKYDIIISEWMGYFLLYEGMLDSLIYARDNYLNAESGLLMPNYCNINICGYGDIERHKNFIQFWDNVYGFDMSTIKIDVLNEANLEICKKEYILTDSNCIADFNLMTVTKNSTNFSYDFKLNVTKDGWLTGLIGWFDVLFELPNKIEFSTSPFGIPTHWKQVIFYIKNPIQMKCGDTINGYFKCYRAPNNPRALKMEINMYNHTHKYTLD